MRRLLLALVCALAATVLPTQAATAQECLPAGGQAVPRPDPPEGDFEITGAGWGHGAGMSQYGAQGAARLGCDAETILRTYFPGVDVAWTPLPSNIRVNLATAATILTVEALDGPVPWQLCTDGACQDLPVVQPEGASWTVRVGDNAGYEVSDDEDRAVWAGGDRNALLVARHDGTVIRVPDTGHRYRWGSLELDSVAYDAGPAMFANLDIAPFDRYLYGLGEVPSSWPEEALQAQVIAARSYALVRREPNVVRADCRCHVYATVVDQVYSGWDKQAESGGERWVAAVDATRAPDFSSAQTMRYQGSTAEGFYSSTHGGHSESAAFTWGGAVPYLQPVDDSRWELASDSAEAGVRSWALSVNAEQLGQAAGVGVATDVELPEPKGAAGRVGHPDRGYGGVVVTGTTGSATLSGDYLRRALGLRSTLFDIRPGATLAQPPEETPGEPLPGTPTPSEPLPGVPVEDQPVSRVAGSDRVGTAVAVSARYWQASADAVLATAAGFADALAAGALAADLDAPLLLTDPAALPQPVADELDRLGASTVWVLGGAQAVSPAVDERLRSLGYDTQRLGGGDRYQTAQFVARRAGASADREVTLAGGVTWPDGVAAGALAASPQQLPTLLTEAGRLPESTRAALAELGTRTVWIVGGAAVVSDEVERELAGLGYEVHRLAGASRYATSAAVAGEALRRLGDGVPIVFSSGENYPDALAAGALAARLGGPLLLVPRDDLDAAPPAGAFVSDHAAALTDGVIVGGPVAVSERVQQQLSERLAQ